MKNVCKQVDLPFLNFHIKKTQINISTAHLNCNFDLTAFSEISEHLMMVEYQNGICCADLRGNFTLDCYTNGTFSCLFI